MTSLDKGVRREKQVAVRELDLMHEAIDAGDLKNAMYHKIIANIAIDEMVSVSKFVEKG
ncbi:MAG: hypothetical protein ACREAY_10770 [Nitrososphaera sp.]|uniref:hypothetical protein n=1 Tax=Nitrososphaera sp. TaxID=1971748 RepID=UPI003D6F5876